MALTYLGIDEHSSFDQFTTQQSDGNAGETAQSIILQSAQFDDVPVPNAEFLSRAVMTQDGQDLIMETPDGLTLIIEGYFARPDTPDLVSPEGNKITPEMVKSFIQAQASDYAQDDLAMNDASPVGHLGEVKGDADIIRTDGSRVHAQSGLQIYQGDVIETHGDGAVNVNFIDESSFAVSSNARLAIDEYVFDPSSYEGTQNFSLLQGAFVYTSGLIGREDPDDVKIDTPIGSIGIRGTIIAGHITSTGLDSTVTVVEGAIVVANATGEVTLDQQYETVHFDGMQSQMDVVGVLSPEVMSNTYNVLRPVAADLFSAVDDSAGDHGNTTNAPNVDTLELDADPQNDAPDANNTDGTEQMHDPSVDDQSFLLQDGNLDFSNISADLAQDDYMDHFLQDSASSGSGSFSDAGNFAQQQPSFGGTGDAVRDPHQSQDIAPPPPQAAPNPPANHAPVLTGVGEHGNEWTAVSGRQYAFDLAELFRDPDGNPLSFQVQSYSVTPGTFVSPSEQPHFEGAAPSTLVFTPNAQGSFDTLTVDVVAIDPSGATSATYTLSFDIFDTGGGVVSVSGASYTSGIGQTMAFGDNVPSTLSLGSTTSSNFQLFGGRVNDVLNLSATTPQTNIELYGGLGSDTLHDFGRGAQIRMYGGGGDDLMIVDNAVALRGLNALTSATLADYHISGGLGRDTLKIGGTGGETLNFSIFSDKIEGIERIKTDNGTAQTLNITAADVLQMTGGKTLFVDGDGSDTVNLSGNGFVSTGHTQTVFENSGNEGGHNVTYTQWLNSAEGVSVYVNDANVA
ncbi:MAG: FecR domain-containing protein [Pseudobdellovibrionaceae bacterium]